MKNVKHGNTIVVRTGDTYNQSGGERIEHGFYYKVSHVINGEGVKLKGIEGTWTWKLFRVINQIRGDIAVKIDFPNE